MKRLLLLASVVLTVSARASAQTADAGVDGKREVAEFKRLVEVAAMVPGAK